MITLEIKQLSKKLKMSSKQKKEVESTVPEMLTTYTVIRL